MNLTTRQRPYLLASPQGLQLLATSSRRSRKPQFPPQAFELAGDEVEDVPLGPSGSLYSYTIVSAGKDTAPYGLAMVDFEPGVRVFGRLLLGPLPPTLGAEVRLVPHPLPDGSGDYAFEATGQTPSGAPA